MWKQFTVQGNTQYLEMLTKTLKEYNNTKHSSIKMTPLEASKKKNEGIIYFNLYGELEPPSKPKFEVGDKVRMSKYKWKVPIARKFERVITRQCSFNRDR